LSLNPQSLGGRRVSDIVGATKVANATKQFGFAQAFRLTKKFTTQVTARTARFPHHDTFRSMTTVTQRATDPHKPEENPFRVGTSDAAAPTSTGWHGAPNNDQCDTDATVRCPR
jgi:hypothetical protein